MAGNRLSAQSHAGFELVPSAESLVDSACEEAANKKTVVSDSPRPQHVRSKSSFDAIVFAIVNFILALLPLCFIVFIIISYSNEGRSTSLPVVKAIMRAATLGPSILPIIFAAVMGKFFTAIAAWRLEKGVQLGTVECLLGSRTVFNTLSIPFRFQALQPFMILLMVAWAFSPIGGLASLRAVHIGEARTNASTTLFYLDSLSPYLIEGASSASTFQYVINAAFTGALVSSGASKNASQDPYGNLKIPLIQPLLSSESDGEGWYSTRGLNSLQYSSLLGLPISGLAHEGVTYFSVESTYIYPACTLSFHNQDAVATRVKMAEAGGVGWGATLVINYDRTRIHNANTPRRITWLSISWPRHNNDPTVTIATCSLTTTYVETQFGCRGLFCATTAVRSSTLPHLSPNYTAIDGLNIFSYWLGSSAMAAELIFRGFVNSTKSDTISSSTDASPLEFYFTHPDFPFAADMVSLNIETEIPQIYAIGDVLFSERFAQLLNTYMISGIAPFAVVGNFSKDYEQLSYYDKYTSLNVSVVRNTSGIFETTEMVLRCNTSWMILLFLSSIIMLLAGLGAMILDILRRGPELIDSFTGMLRESPYIMHGSNSSMEDGSDSARRLWHTRVMLGDVQPDNTNGLIAFGTRNTGDTIQKLKKSRLYA